HTNLPHHRDGLLQLLGGEHHKAAVQRALERWPAEKLESAAAEAGLVVTACRSFAEWDAHAQGRAVASLPLFSIEKIGEAPVLKLAPAQRPLSGIKVLELTHVIAGPVSGRVLAATVPMCSASPRRIRPPCCRSSSIPAEENCRPKSTCVSQAGGKRSRGWRAKPTYSFRAIGPAPSPPTDLARRRSPGGAPASSMPRCTLTATRGHGHCAAASIRWSRLRAD